MQEKSVDNNEIIDICTMFLNRYYNAEDQCLKKRYFNILYALISCHVTKSCISNCTDFYNWCTLDQVTHRILEDVTNTKLEKSADRFVIGRALNEIQKELNRLFEILKKCEGVC